MFRPIFPLFRAMKKEIGQVEARRGNVYCDEQPQGSRKVKTRRASGRGVGVGSVAVSLKRNLSFEDSTRESGAVAVVVLYSELPRSSCSTALLIGIIEAAALKTTS